MVSIRRRDGIGKVPAVEIDGGPVSSAAWLIATISGGSAASSMGRARSGKLPGQFRSDLDRQLEAVDALLTPGPFLIGNRPHLCDFALFGQLVYLSRTPIGAVALDRRDNVERFTASVKIILGAPPPSG